MREPIFVPTPVVPAKAGTHLSLRSPPPPLSVPRGCPLLIPPAPVIPAHIPYPRACGNPSLVPHLLPSSSPPSLLLAYTGTHLSLPLTHHPTAPLPFLVCCTSSSPTFHSDPAAKKLASPLLVLAYAGTHLRPHSRCSREGRNPSFLHTHVIDHYKARFGNRPSPIAPIPTQPVFTMKIALHISSRRGNPSWLPFHLALANAGTHPHFASCALLLPKPLPP